MNFTTYQDYYNNLKEKQELVSLLKEIEKTILHNNLEIPEIWRKSYAHQKQLSLLPRIHRIIDSNLEG
jgi:hypothetical protein